MKIKSILVIGVIVFSMAFAKAQTVMKTMKAGHTFNISLPDYMTKTAGLNAAATIQFINVEKDVAGFIVEDSKEELAILEATFENITTFYEAFIKDFVVDEENRKVSKPVLKKEGNISFMESDVSFYNKEVKTDVYYFVGIVETPTHFYKLICWSSLANKNLYKADFQKILYSLKD